MTKLIGKEQAMRIRVNPIMCEAHGLCAEQADRFA